MPALKATTGMPASTAFFTAGASVAGVGRVTAMPSTLASIALWIRVACLLASGSAEYWNLMLSLAAAAWAPLRMMSQKVSPGGVVGDHGDRHLGRVRLAGIRAGGG